uniref:NADH-ubiquinone oxidoreductase chain 2 n=1 Tax=Drepanepteryx phalaenoides TaxID=560898 RepID=A0A1S5QYN1_9NEOP|nr:NADH dehydrogenase subunit 2 [Drepanepteryx phalaenoides]
MMKNLSKLIFFITLILGSLISISSNTWLGMWMGLEMNLLSFIPLIVNLKNSLSTESALKYFLTQALASSIFLFCILMIFIKNNFLLNEMNQIYWIMNSSLLMKMGAAPFHFWFPEMMEGLSWTMSFLLMTWQKIAPMIIISYCLVFPMIMIIVTLSIVIGSIGGLNQTSLRKIMSYSSINHLGWLLSSLLISSFYWMIYFLFYTLISLAVIFYFNKLNLFYFNQLYSLNNFNPIVKFMIFCNLLSLGGLPPFTGFLPKWIIIQTLSYSNLFLVSTMVVFTLITLFFYIRLTYSAFMINYTELKWINFNELNTNLILSFLVTMGLPIVSLLYLIF